jgi:hypothetical protein
MIRITPIAALPLAALISCSLAVAQDSAPIPKQLAGPPSEFKTMQAPAAKDTAVVSTSALLPITLSQGRSGWTWQGRVAIDGSDPRMVLFSGGDDWQLQTAVPGRSALMDASLAATDVLDGSLGLNNERHAGAGYRFEAAPAGEWTVAIEAAQPTFTEGLLLVGSDSPWALASWPAERNHRVGETLTFNGEMRDADGLATKLRITDATMAITAPDGTKRTVQLVGGSAFSAFADERVATKDLSGSFLADQAGDWTVQMIVRGATPDGTAFVRSTQHAVAVVANDLATTREPLGLAEAIDDTRLAIDLGVSSRRSDGFYRAYAEVWGTIGKAEVPVAWIGGMVPAGQPKLHLDTRWIALSGATEPFELRNVRIEDADHFVPLVQHSRMPLDVASLPRAATRIPDTIDDAMRMGPRPERAGQRAGARLMLVHGYCSGDAWGPVQGQFASSVKFQDFNQNRSHNDFALRIRSFGDQFDSFGIVAHSQGGAAATHLYTYYWSGLDYASGSRLIQSVGTPYQGTALAGNLAAIGNVFGVGCGTNTDLTYSGASNWLSGIPSWARSRVNYYTTSFATAWWRWDYCNIGSDLLLSDPEDGTTERAYGQLPGAYNRGHKTGWCHTEGMRDPAQVRDSSRNSVMSNYAAR